MAASEAISWISEKFSGFSTNRIRTRKIDRIFFLVIVVSGIFVPDLCRAHEADKFPPGVPPYRGLLS